MSENHAFSGVLISLAVLAGLMALFAVANGQDAGRMTVPAGGASQYAAFFPPGTSPEQAFAMVIRAGGLPVAGGVAGFVSLSASADPDYPARLRSAGAIVVMSPLIIAGCQPLDRTTLQVAGIAVPQPPSPFERANGG